MRHRHLLPVLLLAACEARAPRPPDAPRPVTLASAGTESLSERSAARQRETTLIGPRPAGGNGGDGGGGGGGAGGAPIGDGIVLTDVAERLSIPPARTVQFHHSGGIAAFDAEGDGDLDLLVVSDANGFRYLINEGGFRFTDAGDRVEGMPLNPLGVAAGDCDADGDTDVLVTGAGPVALLLNEGGRLRAAAGALTEYADALEPLLWGSAVFFDADGDGDLDLWLGCYTDGTGPGCLDRLFLNDGSCRFVDESRERGLHNPGHALAAAIFDLEHDGDLDLLVSNDFGMSATGNRAFRNDGSGHFTEVSHELALDVELYGMCALVADLDGDSALDLYVTNFARNPMFSAGSTGFVQRDEALGIDGGWIIVPEQLPMDFPYYDPDGSEEERRMARFQALYLRNRPDDPHAFGLTGWAATAVDLDADGWPELHVANGAIGILGEARRQPDRLYRRGDDGVYTDVAPELGLLSHAAKRTAVWADLDDDGDMDGVIGVVTRDEAQPGRDLVYRNDTRDAGQHLKVRLRGRAPNLDGVGAVVTVRTGTRVQIQMRTLATSFLSASTGPLHFGLGEAPQADEIVVRWPNGGGTDLLTGVPAGLVTIVQSAAR